MQTIKQLTINQLLVFQPNDQESVDSMNFQFNY